MVDKEHQLNRGGFLLEWLIGTVLSVVVLSCAVELVMNLSFADRRATEAAETAAMWTSVNRVVGEDAHAAVSASTVSGSLYLWEANGDEIRYSLNALGQLVKVQVGTGGTAVVATGVTLVQFEIEDGLLNLEVQFDGGQSDQASFGGIDSF